MQKVIGLLVVLLVLAVGAIGLVKFDIIEIGFLSSILNDEKDDNNQDNNNQDDEYFNKKIALEAKRGVKKKDIEKIAEENNATNVYYREDIDVYELEFSQNISYEELQHILERIETNSKVEKVTVVEKDDQTKEDESTNDKDEENQTKEDESTNDKDEENQTKEDESTNDKDENSQTKEDESTNDKDEENQTKEDESTNDKDVDDSKSDDKVVEDKAYDDDYIYYKKLNQICKVDKELTEREVIISADVDEGIGFDNECVVYDDWVYCIYNVRPEVSFSYISRVKTNGEDGEYLAKGYNPVIYGDSIYYIKVSFNEDLADDDEKYNEGHEFIGIYKMSLDGTNDTCLIELEDAVLPAFTIANSKIYYSDDNFIGCMNLDGSNYKTLAEFDYRVGGLCVNSDYIYFSSADDYIYSIELSSNTVKQLVYGNIDKVCNGYIYYNTDIYNQAGTNLCRMNMETQETTSIMDLDGIITYLTEVNGKLFVQYNTYADDLEYINSKVSVFNMDGTNEILIDEYYISRPY